MKLQRQQLGTSERANRNGDGEHVCLRVGGKATPHPLARLMVGGRLEGTTRKVRLGRDSRPWPSVTRTHLPSVAVAVAAVAAVEGGVNKRPSKRAC